MPATDLDLGAGAAPPPQWLVLGVNNVCNLHCSMCDVGLGDTSTVFWANLIGDNPTDLPLAAVEALVAQAAAFDPAPKVGLAFTEPLLHPQAVELVAAIKRGGLYAHVTTNGMRLPQLADGLVAAGLDRLTISVDGPPEIHNQVRGHRKSFQRLYEGAELLNQAKQTRGATDPELTFSYTCTDANVGHLAEFLDAVEPLRPSTVFVSQLNFITAAMATAHNAVTEPSWHVTESNLGSIDPAAFDLDRLWQDIQDARAWASEPGRPAVLFSPDVQDPGLLETFYRRPLEFVGGRRCTDPYKMMMVRTDGTVIPAHGRCFDIVMGNAHQTPLREIWNGPAYREFRQTLAAAGGTLPACARCCGIIGKRAEVAV